MLLIYPCLPNFINIFGIKVKNINFVAKIQTDQAISGTGIQQEFGLWNLEIQIIHFPK